MINLIIDGASDAEIENDLATGLLMPTSTSSYIIFVGYRMDLAYYLSHPFSYGFGRRLEDGE